ncbi:MAG: hypothetical protein DMG67_04470 [Acidobacteria bacterium]|nr:MAG: hypothetical protein DMG67_04470 [Acidobacteriota bacterium]
MPVAAPPIPLDRFQPRLFHDIFHHVLNTILVFFIKLLETLFVIGAAGYVLSVIPITAYRLFMVLFEPVGPDEESPPVSEAQHKVS